MAFQYWRHRGQPAKRKFIKLSNAYHGDTVGAVSVGGIDLFHRIFGELLFETYTAPAPYGYRWPTGDEPAQVLKEALAALERVLKEHHEEIAALVMEPMIQGAAGMLDQPRGYISGARELTRKYNVLLIFDEVATGFGRTGRMFACEHENVSPDLMAVAKGLTGGYLPLAATLASEAIYAAFLGDYAEFKTFFHGHTYTANPLACSVALANLELFEKNSVLAALAPKIDYLASRLAGMKPLEGVGDVRQAGFMAGIELVRDKATRAPFEPAERAGARVAERARKKGVMIRPLGSVVVLMPPLAISLAELAALVDAVEASIREVIREMPTAGAAKGGG
jgi:adenosylmethionine-8-amino-7-oxononanoate aminotransferase